MSILYYEPGELKHHGIKGMKWGVRRYRNQDGSLTPAGRKRYDRDYNEHGGDKLHKYSKDVNEHTKSNKIYNANPNKWVQEDLTRTKGLVDSSANMARNLKTVNDKAMKNKPKQQMDLSQMSDKEMRDQINRALLEKQYNDMFAPQTTSKGRETVSQVLETAGDVLMVTGSALSIALAIKQLKG